jgi:hypothetical protein
MGALWHCFTDINHWTVASTAAGAHAELGRARARRSCSGVTGIAGAWDWMPPGGAIWGLKRRISPVKIGVECSLYLAKNMDRIHQS